MRSRKPLAVSPRSNRTNSRFDHARDTISPLRCSVRDWSRTDTCAHAIAPPSIHPPGAESPVHESAITRPGIFDFILIQPGAPEWRIAWAGGRITASSGTRSGTRSSTWIFRSRRRRSSGRRSSRSRARRWTRSAGSVTPTSAGPYDMPRLWRDHIDPRAVRVRGQRREAARLVHGGRALRRRSLQR